MKIILTGTFCIFFNLCFYSSFAQHLPVSEPDYNKPKLFEQLPASIAVNTAALAQLFAVAAGSEVEIPIGVYRFKGTVVSKSKETNATVQSVVIKSTNFLGSAFTFTKITSDNGITFKGRIISRNHSDAYELQIQNGQYLLQKKHQLKLVNE